MSNTKKLEKYFSQKIDNGEELTESELQTIIGTFSRYEILGDTEDKYEILNMFTVVKLSNKYYCLNWKYVSERDAKKLSYKQPIKVYPVKRPMEKYFGQCRVWVDSSGKVLLNY